MMYTSSLHGIKVFLFIFQFMKIITNLWIMNTYVEFIKYDWVEVKLKSTEQKTRI
jgi:hypothetical protein